MIGREELVQKAKEVREAILELASEYIDAAHIEVGQIKAKDDARKLVTIRVADANRYVPYQGHDTSEFTVGDYWAVIFDDWGTIRLLCWISDSVGAGSVPLPPITASDVTNVPAGGIAATDVQAAINELDGEKASTAHKDTHKSGGSDAFAAADVLEAIVKRLQESAGPTNLLLGAVADGQFLKRVGAALVGAAAGATIEIQEDDIKVLDASIINFEGGGGKVVDEGGGKATVDILPGGGAGVDQDQYGNNLIRNSPGQIVTDGAEPQWWDDVTDATITDEDTAGEGIPDKHERCFKVVTTADDKYGYQTLVFADEELLDAGVTVVSLGVWVLCSSANKASIGIYGTNLGLQESAQHSGGGSWEWLEVENVTLDAADASIEVRLIVDTGTAYFTMPMLCVNGTALPWKPRGLKHIARPYATQLALDPTSDVAWTTTDCTANTDPLAIGLEGWGQQYEPNGALGSYARFAHGSHVGAGIAAWVGQPPDICVVGFWFYGTLSTLQCDDGQLVQYAVYEQDNDGDMRVYFRLCGYWMWE